MNAVSRLVFGEHIPNVQTSRIKMEFGGAHICLQAGANDMVETLMNESITRSAGFVHGREMKPEVLRNAITNCKREPYQRTTLYRIAETHRSRPSLPS